MQSRNGKISEDLNLLSHAEVLGSMILRNGKIKRGLDLSSQTEGPSPKKRKLSTMSSPVALPYMGLPPEIWSKICRLVAVKEEPISIWQAHCHSIDMEQITVPISLITTPSELKRMTGYLQLREESTTWALARTCLWMYRETMLIYYHQNTFHIYDLYENTTKFLLYIGPSKCNLITSLSLTQYSYTELLWKLLSKMTALRNIFVSNENWKRHFRFRGHVTFIPNVDARWIYREFEKHLSEHSGELGEPRDSLSWAVDEFRHMLTKTLTYQDQHDLTLLMRSDYQGYLSTIYSWGVVRASIFDFEMTINLRRY